MDNLTLLALAVSVMAALISLAALVMALKIKRAAARNSYALIALCGFLAAAQAFKHFTKGP